MNRFTLRDYGNTRGKDVGYIHVQRETREEEQRGRFSETPPRSSKKLRSETLVPDRHERDENREGREETSGNENLRKWESTKVTRVRERVAREREKKEKRERDSETITG